MPPVYGRSERYIGNADAFAASIKEICLAIDAPSVSIAHESDELGDRVTISGQITEYSTRTILLGMIPRLAKQFNGTVSKSSSVNGDYVNQIVLFLAVS